jgi:aminopeptidase N
MNAGSGRSMNWFWKRWFYDGGYPDLSISSATNTANDYQVTIENIGGKPLPVDLTIFYPDGTVQKVHRDVSCWEQGNRNFVLKFTSSKKPGRLSLGSLYVPDVNKKDNEYVWKDR